MNTYQTPITQASLRSSLLRATGWTLTTAFFVVSTISSSAQSVSIRALPLRITVPFGVAEPNPISNGTGTTNAVQLAIVTSSLGGNPVNFTLTGVPAGASASLTTNSISDDGTTTAFLNFSTTAAVAQGTYDMAIVASGAANYRLPIPVICSYFWSGDSFTNGVSTNISTAGNWLGGAVPGPNDNVVFKDRGAVAASGSPTNVIVAADREFASIRFGQELDQDSTRFYNIEIKPGVALKATGSGGFTMLRDLKGLNRRMDLLFAGGGTLMVSNPAANFSVLVDFQPNITLDMQNLANLVIDVNRIPLGDYRAYPNFFTNGYSSSGTSGGINSAEVSRFVPLVDLAATNYLRASFVDPNNYDDLGWRDYSFTIANYSEQGSTTIPRFRIGYSNVFEMDSMCFGQALSSANNQDNYKFRNSGSYARFRGAAGGNSRMSVLAIADSGSPAAPRSANVRANLNLTDGEIDARVDRLFLGVDRTNNLSSMTIEASLTVASGVFDVNTAYIGYQRSGNNQGSPSSTGFAGPVGTLNINSNANTGGAVFRVNTALELGYTTASVAGGTTTAERTSGRVTVNGGTLLAKTVVVGGVTKLSTNSFITLNGGKLVVTNAIGSANGRLTSFTFAGAAQATLYGVAVGQTNIFVNTMSVPAVGGVKYIRIPQLSGYTSGSATVPLVSYTDNSPDLSGLSIVPPSGLYVKSIKDNTTDKVVEVTFTDEPPTVVVWRGNVNNKWDTTSPNWVTQIGGTQTNYSEGYSVVFDNTVGAGPTTIEIPSPVNPGQVAAAYGVVVSNMSYTFNSGSILGNGTIRKTGTGNLTINANASTAIDLEQGALIGSVGAMVGPTTLRDGTIMTGYAGTINLGLAASNATVNVTGTVNGGLTVNAGAVANSGIINGSVALATNSLLNNQLGATMNVSLPWSVPTNTTLINNGTIVHLGTPNGNLGLTVNGIMKGVGKITQNGVQLSSDVRVTIGAGGTLMIGNSPNEITNVTIAVRLDFNNTSTTTFDVNNSSGVNDKIILSDSPNGFGKVNFGIGNNLGGTLYVNKIAGPAFNGATVLNFFDLTSNSPDNAQPAIPQVVPPPGGGLVWDVQPMLTNLTLQVFAAPMMTNYFTSTNIVFSWPSTYPGWRLERLTNSLAVGLENGSTNWQTVFTGLGGTNSLYYPDTNDLNFYYYRSVRDITNIFPSTFFRLAYP